MIEKPVALITGAANGIGRATALKFASCGYGVALVDIDLSMLNKLKGKLEELNSDFVCMHQDLQDLDAIPDIVDKAVDKWGRIDVLVNNAAWRTVETMRGITPENWEKTLKVSLTAPAFLARDAAAVMEKKEIQGLILNISSVMAKRTGGYCPAYAVCKGGMESLTYELAALYGPKGIRVVAISPGNIEATTLKDDYTDKKGNNISKELSGNMNASTPLQRSGEPEEIAEVCFWLSTGQASFITGTSIVVDGGFSHNFNSYQMKKLQFPNEF